MHTAITPQRPREAKREILEQIKQRVSVEQARSEGLLLIHRATIYRLLKRAQSDEERAFVERWHGYAVILRGDVLSFLTVLCQTCPHRLSFLSLF
jgi:glucokinase